MLIRMKRALWKGGLLTMVIGLLGFTIALAASGDLDTTFSGDGKVTTDFGGNWSELIHRMARQADGKIVAVGDRWDPANSTASTRDFALARYKTGGGLDTTFSGDGKQLTNFGGTDQAMDVAIQASTGKIVVSGQKCTSSWVCDVAIARYNPGGSLDTTFNGTGKKVVDFGTGDNGTYGGLAIQSDGKILVAGYMQKSGGEYDVAVYRLKPGGALDTTFSGDGMLNFGFGAGRYDEATSLILSGGKIIVAGDTCNSSWGACNFAIARLTSTGAFDTTFSGDGKQTTDFGANDYIWDVAVQSDGKIVVAGEKYAASSDAIVLARYRTDGSLDPTFSGDGKQTITIGTYAWPNEVLVQGDGKIVVAGMGTSTDPNGDFALVRLKADGTLDTTFSGDGKLTFGFYAGHHDAAWALIRQSDGKYVLGGTAYDGTQNDFALARVLP